MSKVIVLARFAQVQLIKANKQKKPEWAFSEKEKRALRHLIAYGKAMQQMEEQHGSGDTEERN